MQQNDQNSKALVLTPLVTKLRILQGECGDQAIQSERAGYMLDAADWRRLREQVGRLA